MQRQFITSYSIDHCIDLLRTQIDVEPIRWLYTKPSRPVYGTLTLSSFHLRRRHPQWTSDPHGMYLRGQGTAHPLGTAWIVTAHENLRTHIDRAAYWVIGLLVGLVLMSVSVVASVQTGTFAPSVVAPGLGALGVLILGFVLNRMQCYQNKSDETYLWAFLERVLLPLPDPPAELSHALPLPTNKSGIQQEVYPNR